MTLKYLSTPEQAKKAERVVDKLEDKVKAGTATEQEKERYREGLDHILIYDWLHTKEKPHEKTDNIRIPARKFDRKPIPVRVGSPSVPDSGKLPIPQGQPAARSLVAHLRKKGAPKPEADKRAAGVMAYQTE